MVDCYRVNDGLSVSNGGGHVRTREVRDLGPVGFELKRESNVYMISN
jgi:hypothetical protein